MFLLLKNLSIICTTNIRTSKGSEKNLDWLGTLEPKKHHDSELPGVSFCLIYPRQGAGEANNSETSVGTEERKRRKGGREERKNRKEKVKPPKASSL